MSSIVCQPCGMQMRCKKIGVAAEAMTDVGPYELRMGDAYECPDCGAVVIAGFGRGPLAEHFEDDYADKVASYSPATRYWVNRKEKERYMEAAQ